VPEFAGDARKLCDDTFLAQIQPFGPKDPNTLEAYPDFTDSRYWVREIFEVTPYVIPPRPGSVPTVPTKTLGGGGGGGGRGGQSPAVLPENPPPDFLNRPAWLLDIHDAQKTANEGWPEDGGEAGILPPYYAVRYVVATNLAEVLTADPEGESHALAVTEVEPEEPPEPGQPVPTIDHGGPLVHVFAVSSTEGPPRYFFSKAAGGGATDWGVVRHVPDELQPFVEVSPVRVLDESPWAVVPEDTSKTYRTEPGTLGLHYKQWVWTGADGEGFPDKPVTVDMVVLPIATHGSERIVMHHSRLWYPVPLPSTIIHTDCYITAGGGQLELLGYG
jgi:hypothetical protein